MDVDRVDHQQREAVAQRDQPEGAGPQRLPGGEFLLRRRPAGDPSAAGTGGRRRGGRPSTVSPDLGRRAPEDARQRPAQQDRDDARGERRRRAIRGSAIDQATTGTNIPPRARPNPTDDSARARWTWNQWMIATLTGKKPHRLEPSAMIEERGVEAAERVDLAQQR